MEFHASPRPSGENQNPYSRRTAETEKNSHDYRENSTERSGAYDHVIVIAEDVGMWKRGFPILFHIPTFPYPKRYRVDRARGPGNEMVTQELANLYISKIIGHQNCPSHKILFPHFIFLLSFSEAITNRPRYRRVTRPRTGRRMWAGIGRITRFRALGHVIVPVDLDKIRSGIAAR
jgi:hypothetical protein